MKTEPMAEASAKKARDPEMAAIAKIERVLAGFSWSTQSRVLRYVAERLTERQVVGQAGDWSMEQKRFAEEQQTRAAQQAVGQLHGNGRLIP